MLGLSPWTIITACGDLAWFPVPHSDHAAQRPHAQTSASLQVLSLWPQDWLGGHWPTKAPGCDRKGVVACGPSSGPRGHWP